MLDLIERCTQPVQPTVRLPTLEIANPPFVACKPASDPAYANYDMAYRWTKEGDRQFQKTGKLQSSVGKEALFIERCIKACEVGDVVVVLLPNGILANSGYEYLRWWLIDKVSQIVASIQFPQTMWQVECGLGIVTSILVMRRETERTTRQSDYQIFMAMLDQIGFDSRGKRIYKKDGSGEIDDDFPIVCREFLSFIHEPTAARIEKFVSEAKNTE